MSDLTSTVPAAIDSLLTLVTAAATTDEVTVVDSELEQYEPGTYVELTGMEKYAADVSAIGYSAFIETYELTGLVRVYIGGSNEPKAVRDQAWAAYQKYVITTVVNNKTLGINTAASQMLYCIPFEAEYHGTIVGSGWQGLVEWRLQCQARIQV